MLENKKYKKTIGNVGEIEIFRGKKWRNRNILKK